MSFWNVGSEPKRSNRWYLQMSSNSALQYALKKVDKPSFKVNEITHKYLNHEFYYPGRVEWNPINMTIASVTRPLQNFDPQKAKEDTTYAIHSIFVNSGYIFPKGVTTPAQKTTLSKLRMDGNIGTFKIVQINSLGDPIEEWQLYFPQFTSVTFGSLNYENDEIVDVTVGIEYDWAEVSFNSTDAAKTF